MASTASDPPPPPAPASASARPYSLFPRIPGPLQRLFDAVPLATYPANALPARSPSAAPAAAARGETTTADDAPMLPTLHVFTTADDAAHGRPSFNPSCLKWQTFLRIAGVHFRVAPSTNHASPSGVLPFLLPGIEPAPSSPTSSTSTTTAPPVPSHRLQTYALEHSSLDASARAALAAPPSARQEAYQALLDHRVRNAWLHALYLNDANAPLSAALYAAPASSSAVVQTVLRHQLRRAALTELRKAAPGGGATTPSFSPSSLTSTVDTAVLYAEASDAFRALSAVLGEAEDAWFFGGSGAGPGLFDAAVFSYTHLLLGDGGLAWRDRTLPELVEAFPNLVRHRARLVALLWSDAAVEDSAVWEKI